VAVAVPNFAGVPAFLRGSTMLASMPSLLRDNLMRDFAAVEIPLGAAARALGDLPMYMVWHRRMQQDPANAWLRGLVEQAAARVLGETRHRHR
jgi:hypothetical protein